MDIKHLTGILLVFSSISCYASEKDNSFYGIEEKTGTYLPKEIWALNEDSVLVNIISEIDKPTLLSFVYYKCPGLCTPLLEGIAELIDKSGISAGVNYQVITLSIDPKETPMVAREKKSSIISSMKKKVSADYWHFYTADQKAIKGITEATGWEYIINGDGFIHSVVFLLITPEKKISQYFYGTYFNPMHFQMSVTGAWKENISPPRIETVKYCYNYLRKSEFSVRVIAISTGIVILFAIGLFFINLIKKPI